MPFRHTIEIVRNAAADAGQPVGMAHLLQASRSDYGKLEKPLVKAFRNVALVA